MSETAKTLTSQKLPLARRIRYGFEAAIFFLVLGSFRLLPIDTASRFGGWIGRKFCAPTGLSKPAIRNLEAAYPELSAEARLQILMGMWDNLGRVLGEYAHLDALQRKGAKPRVTVEGIEHLAAAQKRGKGILLISGHFANWELIQFPARQYGLAGAAVARPTNNPYVYRWLERVRANNGLPEQIAKGAQGTRRIFTLLRKGDCIGMLVDQRTSEGVYAPFFGVDAPTTPVPAALAKKLGAVIVPVSNERVNGAHFRLRIHPAIEPADTGNYDRDVLETTAAINAFIEARVREHPEQWLWLHRRWADKGAKLRKRGAQVLSAAGRAAATNATSSRV